MAALREIFASFGIEFDKEERLEKGKKKTETLTQKLKGLGAIIGGSLLISGIRNFSSALIQLADDLDKTSQQLGLTTGELQAFQHAAQLAGVDAAAFNRSIGQLQYNAQNAANGEAAMARAFRQLGVETKDANGELLPGSELLRRVADGLRDTENPTQRMALAMRLMGESGRRMLPMLTDGREGLDELRVELERLGGGVSQEFIDNSVKINDEMTRLRTAFLSVRSGILLFFLPAARWTVKVLTTLAAEIGKNKGALAAMSAVAAALGVVLVGVAVKATAAWIAAGWPILLAALAVGVLYLVVQDLWATWSGGDSILSRFINTLFPGMVDGIDATDLSILNLIAALETVYTFFSALWDLLQPWGTFLIDRIVNPFRAITGAIRDAQEQLSVFSIAVRAVRRLIGLPVDGEGERRMDQRRQQMRDARRGAETIGSMMLRERPSRERLAVRASIAPERLRSRAAMPVPLTRHYNSQSTANIIIHDAGVLSANEAARIAATEVEKAMERNNRQLAADLTPEGSTG